VAILGSRDGANAAQKAGPSNVSTAVLYTDGMIIRLANDDANEPEPGAKHRSPEWENCYWHLVDGDFAAEHVCSCEAADIRTTLSDFENTLVTITPAVISPNPTSAGRSSVGAERNQHPNNNRKRKDSYNARRYERTNNGFSVRESRVSPTHQLFWDSSALRWGAYEGISH
jgi:hypothetical protein